MTDILVLFHSVTGATHRLAEAIAAGAGGIEGCTAQLRRIPDIPGSDVIFGGDDMAETRAAFEAVELATVGDLINHDALAVGTPVYFGSQSSAVRYFFDQAGKFWMEGRLTGKPATAFAGSGSGAGREAALMSLWSTFGVFGMTIVPLGTRAQSATPNAEVTGTTPFGAATLSGGPGDRPSEVELAAARIQGYALAEVARAIGVAVS